MPDASVFIRSHRLGLSFRHKPMNWRKAVEPIHLRHICLADVGARCLSEAKQSDSREMTLLKLMIASLHPWRGTAWKFHCEELVRCECYSTYRTAVLTLSIWGD